MDSTGKIGSRSGSLDNDAVYIKKSSEQTSAANAKKVLDSKTEALKNALDSGLLGEDTVNFSASQAIQAAFGEDAVARAKKVADLKAKVANGSYSVDSKLVAKELANEIAQTIYFSSDANKKDDTQLF